MGIIQRQGIRNAVITYSGIIIGFVNLIIIQPRFLTPEELGLTRVLFSFSALISSFLPLGIQNITLKYFPYFKDPAKKHSGYFGFMLLFPVIGFLFVSGVMLILKNFIIGIYIVNSKLFTDYFDYVFPMILCLSFTQVLTTYSSTLFRTTIPSFINDIVVRIFSIVVVSLYFIKVVSLDRFVFLFVMIYVLQFVLMLLYVLSIDSPSLRMDKEKFSRGEVFTMLRFGLLMSLATVSALGLKYLDVIMLSKFLPLHFAGIYSVAVFIPALIDAPLAALDRITYAKIADAWAKNNLAEIKEIYTKSSRYLFMIGGLLFLGINLNTNSLMKLLPADYSAGITVILIISISSLFNLATGVNDSILYNSAKWISGFYMLLVLLSLAFLLNLFLIPVLGMNGAALATAISSLAFNSMKFFFIRKNFSLQPFEVKTLKILMVIVFTGLAVYLIPPMISPLADIMLRSGIITLLYTGLTYFIKIAPELQPVAMAYARRIFFGKGV
jgi:O-antigen/teichoic acid export membrane protein